MAMLEYLFWLVYSALMGLLGFIYNITLKEEKKLTHEEIEAVLKEKFPKKYEWWYDSLVIVLSLGMVVFGWFLFFWIGNPKTIHTAEEVLYFFRSDSSAFVYMVVFLFLGIFLWGIVIAKLSLKYPPFGRYVKKVELTRSPYKSRKRRDYAQEHRLGWYCFR